MMRTLLLAGLLLASACAPEPWRSTIIVAEHLGPYDQNRFQADRALVAGAHPQAPAARLMLAGVDAPTAEAGRAIVLRCARSSLALSFFSAELPADIAARAGDVLLVWAAPDGRARVTRVLTGPDLPAGQVVWRDGMAVARPDRARYVHWRGERWIVRCRQPGLTGPGPG